MKSKIMTRYLCPAACLAALWLGNTIGLAQSTFTWDGGASTANWNDGDNWNPDGVPLGSSTTANTAPYPANMTNAVLPASTSPYTVAYDGTDGLVNYLTLNSNATMNVAGTFVVSGPNHTTAYGILRLAQSAAVTVNPGATLTTAAGALVENRSLANIAAGAELKTNTRTTLINEIRTAAELRVAGTWTVNRGVNIQIRNSSLAGAGSTLMIDGGTLSIPVFGTVRASISLGQESLGNNANTLIVTNNGIVSLTEGILLGGVFNTSQATGGINHNAVHLSSGTVSLGQAMLLGRPGSSTGAHNNAQRVSTNTVTMTGGSLSAGAGVIAGAGRVGIVNLSGGALSTGAGAHLDIGGFITGLITPTTAAHGGEVHVSGGSLTVGAGGAIRLAGSVLENSTQVYDGFWSPGRLNLTGGTVTTDALVATNGAFSAISFAGGTLRVNTATEIDNGVAFTVGNGTAEAVLGLGAGSTHTFADGLVINTNAVLTVGGTNAIGSATINGDLTLHQDAVLDLDFNATTNDWLQVNGVVTLPTQGTLRARALDSSVRTTIPVLQATSITGSVGQWNRVTVNGVSYGLAIEGNQLVLGLPRGTMIVIR